MCVSLNTGVTCQDHPDDPPAGADQPPVEVMEDADGYVWAVNAASQKKIRMLGAGLARSRVVFRPLPVYFVWRQDGLTSGISEACDIV